MNGMVSVLGAHNGTFQLCHFTVIRTIGEHRTPGFVYKHCHVPVTVLLSTFATSIINDLERLYEAIKRLIKATRQCIKRFLKTKR